MGLQRGREEFSGYPGRGGLPPGGRKWLFVACIARFLYMIPVKGIQSISSAKKSFPLSSTRIKAGKSFTVIM